MESQTVENYVKVIYRLSGDGMRKVSVSAIAKALQNNPASVSDMVRRLTEKNLVCYDRSKGLVLSDEGYQLAVKVTRKHRLWETFLSRKLGFKWDEVHDIAEQLEHVQSDRMIDNLAKFLNYPVTDPHGDPIPRKDGTLPHLNTIPLTHGKTGGLYILKCVTLDSHEFLQFLDNKNLRIDDKITILEKEEFDGSVKLLKTGGEKVYLSKKAAANLLVIESED